MGEDSKIEWTDHTFNPWTGCQHVSPGCDYCYAESLSRRAPKNFGSWKPGGERKRTSPSYWMQPHRWNKRAAEAGRREKVFCASLADVFDNQAPAEWREDLFEVIRATPNLDWLLLTKRPQNILKLLPGGRRALPPNIWFGTSAEDQKRLEERVHWLLDVPAPVHFLSCEPLLGPLNLRRVTGGLAQWTDALSGVSYHGPGNAPIGRKIGWVIVGGESGPNARPMHPDWVRNIRDQCVDAGTPFLLKQNGEWVSVSEIEGEGRHYQFPDGATVRRVGKAKAGAMIDGHEWRQFPAPQKEASAA